MIYLLKFNCLASEASLKDQGPIERKLNHVVFLVLEIWVIPNGVSFPNFGHASEPEFSYRAGHVSTKGTR